MLLFVLDGVVVVVCLGRGCCCLSWMGLLLFVLDGVVVVCLGRGFYCLSWMGLLLLALDWVVVVVCLGLILFVLDGVVINLGLGCCCCYLTWVELLLIFLNT